MHFSIIINEHAGGGNAEGAWKRIKGRLNQTGIAYTPWLTRGPQHATYLAKKAADRLAGQPEEIVLVIGGDGTLHETLNGLMQSEQNRRNPLPLAYIPSGTGNDFARGYGINSDPIKALDQVLTASESKLITVGHYYEAIKGEEGFFLNNVGIGYDAAIVSKTNASKRKKQMNKLRLGHFSYLANALGALYDQQPFELKVENGKYHDAFHKAYIVIASNHPFIGGGFRIAPDTSLTDPKLDLLVAERKNWLVTFNQLIQFARGKLAHSRFAKRYSARQVRYSTTSLEFGQMDGEEMGNRFVDLTLDTAAYPFWQVPELATPAKRSKPKKKKHQK